MPSSRRIRLWPSLACVLAATVALLAVARPALADVESARRALDAQDYETAYREAQPLAEQGDEYARRIAMLAKLMIDLKRLEDERLAATGRIDLRDYDGRFRPQRSEAEERQFDKGLRHAEAQEYEAAFAKWLPLAESGDAEAQYEIAILYRQGHGVAPDREMAERYLRRSAQQGHARAQGELAGFLNPFGISQDEDVRRESAYWALRAAANGDAWGYSALSRAYCHGHGIDKNPVLADVWLYMIFPSKEHFLRYYCNSSVELPTPYYEAIAERAEAMRRAYDLPLAVQEEEAEGMGSSSDER